MSWYNPTTWGKDIALQNRSAELPQKVFVADGGKYQFGMGYEYSEYEPATINWSIDNLLYGGYGRQNFIELFYCLPEIFAPVHEIASRVADACWQLRSTNKANAVDTNNADFNRLFTNPNPLMGFKQFVYQAVCYELLTGANIEYLNKPATLPDELGSVLSWFNLPTPKVKIDVKQNVDVYSSTNITDLVNSYTIGSRNFPIQNVISLVTHDLKFGNSVDKFASPLLGAKLAIKNLIPVYEARGVIYIKRGALGFLVSKKSDESGLISLTSKEKEQAQKDFQESYGLRGDKSTVGVTAAPLEFIKTSMSIAELLPFDETLADATAIYACLRVPKHLIPNKDSSTYANADADMKSFYGDLIIPMANRYAQVWSNKFNIPNRYIYADFSKVAILQENLKEKAAVDQINGNVWLQRFTSGVGTLNQWILSWNGAPIAGIPLYDQTIYQMSPEDLETVNKIINLKAVSTGTPGQTQGSTEKPTLE